MTTSSETGPLTQHQFHEFLCDEAWHGRWDVYSETNIRPAAGVTARTIYEAGLVVVRPGEFVLDRIENQHPAMIHRALHLRESFHEVSRSSTWPVYLMCMKDATGCTEEQINAWLDRHES